MGLLLVVLSVRVNHAMNLSHKFYLLLGDLVPVDLTQILQDNWYLGSLLVTQFNLNPSMDK